MTSNVDHEIAAGAALTRKILIGAIFAGILMIALAIFTAMRVSKPLGRIKTVIERLPGGDKEAQAEQTRLAEGASKIGEVVSLNNDIASQTNLLALNATIEAARAGEAVKGFAVVATEIKSLADQTAKATEEIIGQINEIQAATSDAVEAIATIGETIRSVDDISSSIAAAVEEQGASTREIAQSIQ